MALPMNKIGNHSGAWDSSAQRDVLQSNCQLPFVLTGSADALAWPASYIVNSSVVDAMTLGTPIAGDPLVGGDDGKTITVADVGGHAHTITTANNVIINSKKTLTFNGTIGSFVELQAWNGLWIVLANTGITIS